MEAEEIEITPEQLSLDVDFLNACQNLDEDRIHDLVDKDCDVWFQDTESGKGPLHLIVEASHHLSNESLGIQLLDYLLANGAVWNQVSKANELPGCTARRLFGSSSRIYETLLNAGVRAELLLTALDSQSGSYNDDPKDRNAAFLNGKLEYIDATQDSQTLLDQDRNAVMMTWESEIMTRSAELVVPTPGSGSVLNIGFGLGLIDTAIQKRNPSRHVIIEAHPDVLRYMRQSGWYDKPNVQVLEGRWQDLVDALSNHETFDGVYYDPFEYYADMHAFFDPLVALLNPSGTFSFFHGLGADNQTIYDVYTRILEIEVREFGLDCTFEEIKVETREEEWKGAKRRYWDLEKYRLPTCRFMQ